MGMLFAEHRFLESAAQSAKQLKAPLKSMTVVDPDVMSPRPHVILRNLSVRITFCLPHPQAPLHRLVHAIQFERRS